MEKKQQQLQVDQDLLADRRTKAWAVEEYRLKRRTKYYPKRRILPQFEEAALNIKRMPTPRR